MEGVIYLYLDSNVTIWHHQMIYYWKHNKSQYTVIDGNIPYLFKKKSSEEITSSEVCLPSAGDELSTGETSPAWIYEREMWTTIIFRFLKKILEKYIKSMLHKN